MYLYLTYFHLLTVVPAFFIGGFLLLNRKGTRIHKQLGKLYLALMFSTGFITFFMSSPETGQKIFNHFGYLHIFTILVLYQVPTAYFSAKNGNIKVHRFHMILLYVGGI
jgi:uncharacterized membrane protein